MHSLTERDRILTAGSCDTRRILSGCALSGWTCGNLTSTPGAWGTHSRPSVAGPAAGWRAE